MENSACLAEALSNCVIQAGMNDHLLQTREVSQSAGQCETEVWAARVLNSLATEASSSAGRGAQACGLRRMSANTISRNLSAVGSDPFLSTTLSSTEMSLDET